MQSYLNCLAGLFQKKPLQVDYFHSGAMARKIRELYHTGHFDAVHVQHLRMAQYWDGYRDIPRILDLPDAYSLYWKRRIQAKSGLLKMAATIEQKRVFDYEDILKEYDLSLVCSREDQAWLENEKGISNVRILPNGVDLTTFSGGPHDYALCDKILFTGNMDYAPNVDAVIYFAEEIFPLIQKKIKNIQFIIAGQRPVKKVQALANKHIVVTGFVEDLARYYKTAAVVVAPLRFGAGTQNKVLEAMAMGVPVVSRNIGFNGLNIQSGEGVILATETEAFAEACIGLLSSAELREQTGEKGKQVIQSRFDWKVIARKLERYFEEIVKQGL
jgi:glycosyltransferase involved in cell wall biosynthesis